MANALSNSTGLKPTVAAKADRFAIANLEGLGFMGSLYNVWEECEFFVVLAPAAAHNRAQQDTAIRPRGHRSGDREQVGRRWTR
jgi:hypothetical protein